MRSTRRSAVLLVFTSKESRRNCEAGLEAMDVDILSVPDLQRARSLLREENSIDVVVTEASLPDGNWSDVFRCVVDEGDPAGVVVCTPIADEHLWSEVLWRGGHDLLVEPFQPTEAQQVIQGARRAAQLAAMKGLPKGASSEQAEQAAAAWTH